VCPPVCLFSVWRARPAKIRERQRAFTPGRGVATQNRSSTSRPASPPTVGRLRDENPPGCVPFSRTRGERPSERASERRNGGKCIRVRVCESVRARVCSSLAASTGIGNSTAVEERRRGARRFVRSRGCLALVFPRASSGIVFSRVSATRRGNDELTNTIHSGGWSVGRSVGRSVLRVDEERARKRGRGRERKIVARATRVWDREGERNA